MSVEMLHGDLGLVSVCPGSNYLQSSRNSYLAPPTYEKRKAVNGCHGITIIIASTLAASREEGLESCHDGMHVG